MRPVHLKAAVILLCGALLGPPAVVSVAAESPALVYTRILARERLLREEANKATAQEIRGVIRAYEGMARRYPASGYSDNALWQAAGLAVMAFERYREDADRKTGLRLLDELKQRYPSSSLVRRAGEVRALLDAAGTGPGKPGSYNADASAAPTAGAGLGRPDTASQPVGPVALRDITRTTLPDGMRVTIELDGEPIYRAEQLEKPRRVFFDLKNVRPVAALQDATLRFNDDIVREIRLGRHPQNTTRVVLDMAGADSYSAFTLYEPFRLVIDFKRDTAASATPPPAGLPPLSRNPIAAIGPTPVDSKPVPMKPAETKPAPPKPETKPTPDLPVTPLTPPALPTANSNGQFSLARQLGLGISRIVIDAGHGGHDPGAQSNGIVEAELVLDVAQRLMKLLQKQPGVEVVMTRDSDVFIPLEERTAIANREGADLFLSIHANASRNKLARGVETYFLNFATNPDAEAVAARENATSGRTMHSLPEIVRAIALNNKIDESRDLAASVQKAIVRRLSPRNRQLKNLGVKQAPFVVLIGAMMPSVLAEISFITNKQEATLLRTGAYRQHLAEALLDGVLKYQQSLKKPRAIASTR